MISGRTAAVVFGLGVAVMLALDSNLARLAGVLLLLAGIALTVAATATPDFLSGDDPDA